MELNIDLQLSDKELNVLKTFIKEDRQLLKGYHPIVYHLIYLGVLLTTKLEENGKYNTNTYVLPSGIGKIILKML